jgi:hypothetical protein
MNEGGKERRNEGRTARRKEGRMDRRKQARKEGNRSIKMTLEYKKTNFFFFSDTATTEIYTPVITDVRQVTSYQNNYRPFKRQRYRVEQLNFTVY